jgi:hypothetical protein
MTSGAALAQEFTTIRHIAPQSEPSRPSADLPVQKAYGGFKQIAASEAAGVSTIWQRRASRGCGSSRPTGAALCRAIVLRRILI